MAVLYITEFVSQSTDPYANPQSVALQPPVNEQTVSIGGASAQSSAFKNNTGFIRIHTDAICSIEFGTNPTATVTTARMAANQTEYFAVPRTAGYKIAVIANT